MTTSCEPKQAFDEATRTFATLYATVSDHARETGERERTRLRAKLFVSTREMQLAEADVAYANSRLKMLQSLRDRRRMISQNITGISQIQTAQCALLRACANGSQQDIIAAQEEHANALRKFGPVICEYEQLSQQVGKIITAHREVKTLHSRLVQQYADAVAQLRAAEKSCNVHKTKQVDFKRDLTQAQNHIIEASASVTGTSIRSMWYSFALETIGLTLPNTGEPHSPGYSLEDRELKCAAGEYDEWSDPLREY
jgi:hypothetical protein